MERNSRTQGDYCDTRRYRSSDPLGKSAMACGNLQHSRNAPSALRSARYETNRGIEHHDVCCLYGIANRLRNQWILSPRPYSDVEYGTGRNRKLNDRHHHSLTTLTKAANTPRSYGGFHLFSVKTERLSPSTDFTVLSALHFVHLCLISYFLPLTSTPIGFIMPPHVSALSPGCTSTCFDHRHLGQ